MAKKSKRQTRKGSPRAVQTPVSQTVPKSLDFNPDYSYVAKDLRTIGILAGTFVTAMIILSFFIH